MKSMNKLQYNISCHTLQTKLLTVLQRHEGMHLYSNTNTILIVYISIHAYAPCFASRGGGLEPSESCTCEIALLSTAIILVK